MLYLQWSVAGALWFGFFAPANLPKPIADRLITEITAILKDPAALAKYQAAGNVPVADASRSLPVGSMIRPPTTIGLFQ